jgi:hypothetical protein
MVSVDIRVVRGGQVGVDSVGWLDPWRQSTNRRWGTVVGTPPFFPPMRIASTHRAAALDNSSGPPCGPWQPATSRSASGNSVRSWPIPARRLAFPNFHGTATIAA